MNDNGLTLVDILIIIARHLKIVILIPAVCCAISFVYLNIFSIPFFTSNAKIMSSSANSNNLSGAAGLAAQFGITIPNSNSNSQLSYPEIVKSRKLARNILERKFDTKEFGPKKPLLNILTNSKESENSETLVISGISSLLSMIHIELSSGSIYRLSITAKESYFAKNLADVVIDELENYLKNYNSKKISETRIFIQERIKQTQMELGGAEEELKNFRSRNRRIENSPALQLEQQRLLREVTVLTGVFTTLKSQLETAKIQEYKDMADVIIIDPPNLPISPSKPNKRFIIIMNGFLSFGFSILLIFLLELYNTTLKNNSSKINELRSLLLSSFHRK